jgi:carbonic anhydrase/acetyltransferase-like protein (isoleucine patch superfamily)
VIGTPGKVVRKLSNEEIQRINSASGFYVRKFKRYQQALKPDEV